LRKAADQKRIYLGIVCGSGQQRPAIMASPCRRHGYREGGGETPHLIFKEFVNPTWAFQPFSLRKLAFKLGLTGELLTPTTKNHRGALPRI